MTRIKNSKTVLTYIGLVELGKLRIFGRFTSVEVFYGFDLGFSVFDQFFQGRCGSFKRRNERDRSVFRVVLVVVNIPNQI